MRPVRVANILQRRSEIFLLCLTFGDNIPMHLSLRSIFLSLIVKPTSHSYKRFFDVFQPFHCYCDPLIVDYNWYSLEKIKLSSYCVSLRPSNQLITVAGTLTKGDSGCEGIK